MSPCLPAWHAAAYALCHASLHCLPATFLLYIPSCLPVLCHCTPGSSLCGVAWQYKGTLCAACNHASCLACYTCHAFILMPFSFCMPTSLSFHAYSFLIFCHTLPSYMCFLLYVYYMCIIVPLGSVGTGSSRYPTIPRALPVLRHVITSSPFCAPYLWRRVDGFCAHAALATSCRLAHTQHTTCRILHACGCLPPARHSRDAPAHCLRIPHIRLICWCVRLPLPLLRLRDGRKVLRRARRGVHDADY